MGVNIKGGNNSAGLANVSSTYQLEVRTPQTQTNAGFVQLSTENDTGSITGSRSVTALEASDDYRLRVSTDQTIFNLSFEGTNAATAHFIQGATTKTLTQQSNFMVLNSGNSGANAGVATFRTYRWFPLVGTYPLYADMWLKDIGLAGEVSEWGLYQLASTTSTAAPTDGVFFRRTTSGILKGIANYGGVETEITINETNIPSRDGVGVWDAGETNHYLISIHNDYLKFWINDVLVGQIQSPSAQATFCQAAAQPLHFRVYNSTGGTVNARRLEIGFVNVSFGDQNVNKPWPHVMCGSGGGAHQNQTGSAAGPTVTRASGSTGWPASATARIAGTWTATSAPALNNLGGLWTSPAISTLTSDADYPVFAYPNPTASATIPGKTLYITGIRVGEAYVSAAASTNAIFLSYFVAVASTASATSTADATTTVAPRAIAVGGHGFSATEAIGNYKSGFEMRFDAPLVVPAGAYFHFIVRPFGTVTSNTLVVTSSLAVNGYFE